MCRERRPDRLLQRPAAWEVHGHEGGQEELRAFVCTKQIMSEEDVQLIYFNK